MNRFKRALFGYRCDAVEAMVELTEVRVQDLEAANEFQRGTLIHLEAETASLANMVVEREREIRVLGERLQEANGFHERSIATLDAITARLEELEAQARGQATRIRMKALREAVEVSRKVKALTEMEPALQAEAQQAEQDAAGEGLFEGPVKLEIGPLGDFSQLVGFEDAVGRLGASEIKVDRFSEGRATFSMRLDQPVDLLSELEELSDVDFKVRRSAPGNLVLDVDEDHGPDSQAA
jgi:chromosome segregation ATPase